MDKETYARIKRAYQITINGCGKDCLECERETCLCDSKQIKRDARKWVKQKASERQFYKDHREQRLKTSKAYYDRFHKVANPHEMRKISNDLLLLLPDAFDYEMAAHAWTSDYHCMHERVKRFISRGFLTKHRQGVKVVCKKTELYYQTFPSEVKNEQ